MKDKRADFFAALAEYEHYYGKLDVREYIFNHVEIDSFKQFISTLNEDIMEAIRK